MRERIDLSGEVMEVAQQAVTIVKFWDTGVIPAPNLPIEKAEAAIEQNKDAVRNFSSKIIGIITSPELVRFWHPADHSDVYSPSGCLYYENHEFRDDKGYYFSTTYTVELVGQEDSLNIVFRNRRSGKYTPPERVEEIVEEFQTDLSQRYPSSEGNAWQFEVDRYDRKTTTNQARTISSTRESYSLKAIKNLEADDLASNFHLFGGFIRGSNRIFAYVQNRIAGLTIASEQSTRLQAITDACLRATAILEEVIEQK